MEPSSIATLVSLLGQCSYRIYTFCQQARVVDERISALHRQVDGLRNVLHGLAELFSREAVLSHRARNRPLWDSVSQVLNDCFATARELDRKLSELDASGPSSNAVHRMARTGRMMLRQDDIDRLRSDLQTRSINVQFAVGMINLLVTASGNNTITNVLTTRFDLLEQMMMSIDAHLAAQHSPVAESSSPGIRLDSNTRRLRRAATDVWSSASTSTSSNRSDGVTRPAQPLVTVFEYVEMGPQGTAAQGESTAGSELGAPMQLGQRTQITCWLNGVSEGSETATEPVSTAPFGDAMSHSTKLDEGGGHPPFPVTLRPERRRSTCTQGAIYALILIAVFFIAVVVAVPVAVLKTRDNQVSTAPVTVTASSSSSNAEGSTSSTSSKSSANPVTAAKTIRPATSTSATTSQTSMISSTSLAVPSSPDSTSTPLSASSQGTAAGDSASSLIVNLSPGQTAVPAGSPSFATSFELYSDEACQDPILIYGTDSSDGICHSLGNSPGSIYPSYVKSGCALNVYSDFYCASVSQRVVANVGSCLPKPYTNMLSFTIDC